MSKPSKLLASGAIALGLASAALPAKAEPTHRRAGAWRLCRRIGLEAGLRPPDQEGLQGLDRSAARDKPGEATLRQRGASSICRTDPSCWSVTAGAARSSPMPAPTPRSRRLSISLR